MFTLADEFSPPRAQRARGPEKVRRICPALNQGWGMDCGLKTQPAKRRIQAGGFYTGLESLFRKETEFYAPAPYLFR